jgi:hypothetical protein
MDFFLRRQKKRSPEEEERLRLAREAFIAEVETKMKTDPLWCWDMPHPDTERFRNRVLNHPVLQAHYRPDLLDKRYRYQRPSKEVVEKAIADALWSSGHNFLERTLKEGGVYWGDKGNLQKGSEVCMLFFSKVTKEDFGKLEVRPFPAGLGERTEP